MGKHVKAMDSQNKNKIQRFRKWTNNEQTKQMLSKCESKANRQTTFQEMHSQKMTKTICSGNGVKQPNNTNMPKKYVHQQEQTTQMIKTYAQRTKTYFQEMNPKSQAQTNVHEMKPTTQQKHNNCSMTVPT